MLYIYRASAGSGKTFLLAGFFIELLFRKELTPALEGKEMLFNEILAVTFTNKATSEMKQRIINDLNTLWHTPRESNYYEKIKVPDSNGVVMSDQQIQERAHQILHDMLTDYSSLNVSTIDSFFQQVIRSFAHELNAQGNYEIELDADMVLDHAVSQFLLNLDPQKDPETYDWLLRFSNNRLLDGSNWNVHAELVKLAKVLTTEEYRKHSIKVNRFTSDKRQMNDYLELLNQTIGKWYSTLRRIGTDCCNLLQSCGLKAEDFSGGASKSAANHFAKWANGEETKITKTLITWSNERDKWFSGANKNRLTQMGSKADTLQQLLVEVIDHMSGVPYIIFKSALSIRKNFYQLGLLSRLEQEANDYCAQQGIKLLSNTTQMLNALVAEQSAPFIYEKTGTRILSYMIDEFQDTSGMQWSNFAPLLENSLGTDNRNLIVGDVKQSIYRWRGSDWALLHSHINSFLPEKQATDENGNHLNDNWRSDRKIIDFNNKFFAFASEYLRQLEPEDASFQTIQDIYADVEQTISSERVKVYKKNGKPDVPQGSIAFEKLKGATVDEYAESVMTRLPELVIAIQQQGHSSGHILILCRKRDQCHLCAKALMDYKAAHPDLPYGMNIITQEALLLYKQPVIRALVSVLQFLLEPKSPYRHAIAGINWIALSAESITQAIDLYFTHGQNPNFEALLNLPLYETVERLIAMLPQSARKERNFIQAFCDVVLAFCSKEGPDLSAFLRWWRDKGQECSVTTPEQEDAIRIMTIHQSKGLDGKVVIVPFANDSLDMKVSGNRRSLLWCEPQVEPFAAPDLVVPIEITSKMQETIFCHDYNAERVRAIIDNLNTAYVAFTRARNGMILLSPDPEGKESAELPYLLDTFFQKWDESLDTYTIDADQMERDRENLLANKQKEPLQHTEETIVETYDAPLPLIKKTEYIAPDDHATHRGTTLHDAFSAVIDRTQIAEPITRLFESGQKECKGYEIYEVIQIVQNAIAKTRHPEWFDPANRVLNEQDIITHTTHTQRPDRIVLTPDGRAIVIDYKSGETEPDKYRSQVAHYMNLLHQMGFNQVEGYLWYFNKDEEEAIDMEQELSKARQRYERELAKRFASQ